MPKVEIFETRDGSHSLLLPEMNETYHSTHGAVTESLYVFIDKGLKHLLKEQPALKEVNILEVGFGTGLNAWLTAVEAANLGIKVNFVTLEKFPLEKEIWSQLNYAQSESDQKLFKSVHEAKWNSMEKVSQNFSIQKLETDIFEFKPEDMSFDLVYFDAFAPSKQPEMWQPEVLEKMYNALKKSGVFVTYCAQGQFKRDFKSAGFVAEELEGPPGKKEMTRGKK
ncbi:tRNA (5-methylaminomethyl-2-thiouridine)(34)-methyltransferase MnmD [Reichenbachiella ulvae]|uniref:tRNA (5-methylaminomethyl-2-thiouridine)(34)-methyltransferase MnmD n=1 Tax=Reichenbachiella ulvae TaxID=2980104 RepID=A0ABT3CX59_9BACT|nr:tRNA (5-methylaminomethyl-2-thiouridine)(34)-methyltransferase MnmD [Reichenbachiella ulvae]MCV9388192.1 tRNA (5-methylaminomethyl-2-thiouridine)(34)-methyltransferase MnmD [Reichenbachiella ulvae]